MLAVVGDIDPEQTLAWVEKYFGSIAGHEGKQPPRDGSLPEVMGGQQREVLVEDVPARALMAAYRLPHDGTRESDAADLALTALGGGESSRLHNRLVRRDRSAVAAGFGLLRLAGAPSLGWLDVKASGGVDVADIETAVDEELERFAAEGPSAEEMERAQAQLEREWLDRLATVGGRADELCRYAVLFGDPQLALTAVPRILAGHRRGGARRRGGPAASRQPGGARLRARRAGNRRRGRDEHSRGDRFVTENAATMDFHPRPSGGRPGPGPSPPPNAAACPTA